METRSDLMLAVAQTGAESKGGAVLIGAIIVWVLIALSNGGDKGGKK